MVTVAAVALVWFGMVMAISFMEAPLKFRAPGVSLPIGLAIGRIVFRALNTVEVVLAAAIIAVAASQWSWHAPYIGIIVAMVMLIAQLVLIRPVLHRRSNDVLEGNVSDKRSGIHWVYVGADVIKVIALLAAAIALL